jgi:hypothetical protein
VDFKLVAEKILTAFINTEVRYALMGGFALGIWGVHRATVDMDFLVHRDDLGKVQDIMAEMDYKCVYHTENVSQYVSSLEILGEVDFLHAFRKVSLGMLERAEEKDIFGGKLKIRVLKPEDLIGLKVQAMANDPSRKPIDLNDIESLMSLHRANLDWNLIDEYFAIFGFVEEAKELRKKYSGSW